MKLAVLFIGVLAVQSCLSVANASNRPSLKATKAVLSTALSCARDALKCKDMKLGEESVVKTEFDAFFAYQNEVTKNLLTLIERDIRKVIMIESLAESAVESQGAYRRFLKGENANAHSVLEAIEAGIKDRVKPMETLRDSVAVVFEIAKKHEEPLNRHEAFRRVEYALHGSLDRISALSGRNQELSIGQYVGRATSLSNTEYHPFVYADPRTTTLEMLLKDESQGLVTGVKYGWFANDCRLGTVKFDPGFIASALGTGKQKAISVRCYEAWWSKGITIDKASREIHVYFTVHRYRGGMVGSVSKSYRSYPSYEEVQKAFDSLLGE